MNIKNKILTKIMGFYIGNDWRWHRIIECESDREKTLLFFRLDEVTPDVTRHLERWDRLIAGEFRGKLNNGESYRTEGFQHRGSSADIRVAKIPARR